MNIRATNHVVYMPSTMTHAETAVKRPAGTSRPSGLEALFLRAVLFIVTMPRRQAVMTELNRLSDRELADIGLSRGDIAQVFSRTR